MPFTGLAADSSYPEGIEAQTRQTMANLIRVLEGGALSLADVLVVRIYLTHFEEDYQQMNAVYAGFFPPERRPGGAPASACPASRGVRASRSICWPAGPRRRDDRERSLRVHAITYAAQGINFYELRDPNGGELPLLRPARTSTYTSATGWCGSIRWSTRKRSAGAMCSGLKRDSKSRGGSAWIHEHWRCGDRVDIGARRNNFGLHENAPYSLLLGGGIGITPLLSMAARLQALGRSWQLHYAVRTRAEAVPTGELDPARVHLHIDDEHAGALLDLAAVLGTGPSEAHLYCCGPEPMLENFLALARTRPNEHVHVERFGAEVASDRTGGFHVELARSKQRVYVAPGRTIIDALRGEGLPVVTSCEQGICGTCETRVLAGTPDHRDLLLSDEEKAGNGVMMICCSGSKDELLVLDL